MTTTDHAKEIRKAYKAKGWNSRMVSVRSEYFSMGSSIDVTVKDARVNVEDAKRIAKGHDRVDRCQYSGEILSGGNRYVSVRISDQAREALGTPYLDRVREAIKKRNQEESDSVIIAITESDSEEGFFGVGKSSCGYRLTLWGEHSHIQAYNNDLEYGAKEMACRIALEIQKREAVPA
ncbi:MAG: hypothetical protein ACYSWU_00860 [Planctomycetota bacterium]|jgi:hypothetical protein